MMQTIAITPYNFVRTRRKYIPVGSCFSSMKNTVLSKVHCALAATAISKKCSLKLH